MNNQKVYLEISDNGDGILPEVLPRIFDPFYTTKKVGNGTGLGLPIALGTIERHKGSIEIDNKPGEGATFIVTLPIYERE